MDDNGDYCVIVGISDINEAEKALRRTEREWYGQEHTEPPLAIEDFSAADIYHGTKNGEDCYYWGNNDPAIYFDNGKYERERGFIASLI